MKSFSRICSRAVTVSALVLSSQVVTAEDDTFKIAQPLILAPSVDVVLENHKPRWRILARNISWARTIKLKEDLTFTGARGTYELKANEELVGIVDLGAWQERDVNPEWLFNPDNVDPQMARLLGGRDTAKDEDADQKQKRADRAALRNKLFMKLHESMRLDTIDLSAIKDTQWLYCGEGEFVTHEGKERGMEICLGDSDGDGMLDRAATPTFSSISKLGKHNASPIEAADLKAAFESVNPGETGFNAFAMVHRKKKEYSLKMGVTDRDAKQINLKRAGMLSSMTQSFEDGGVEQEVWGDLVKVQMAEKKKRVDVTVKSSGKATAVIFPYDLTFPET